MLWMVVYVYISCLNWELGLYIYIVHKHQIKSKLDKMFVAA